MRYQTLLQRIMDGKTDHPAISLRNLARKLEISPPSLHNYMYEPVHPRRDALGKMEQLTGEPPCLLLSDEDDLTAAIFLETRKLTDNQKQQLLEIIRTMRASQ